MYTLKEKAIVLLDRSKEFHKGVKNEEHGIAERFGIIGLSNYKELAVDVKDIIDLANDIQSDINEIIAEEANTAGVQLDETLN